MDLTCVSWISRQILYHCASTNNSPSVVMKCVKWDREEWGKGFIPWVNGELYKGDIRSGLKYYCVTKEILDQVLNITVSNPGCRDPQVVRS